MFCDLACVNTFFSPHLQHSPYLMEFTLHYQHLRRRAVQLQAGGVEGGAHRRNPPRWGYETVTRRMARDGNGG